MAVLDLNGVKYEVAQESLMPTGKRAWTTKQRPSQQSDPSTEVRASYRVSGGIGASREDVAGGLGLDYADNLDTRNDGLLTSTAARNGVTLSSADPATGLLTLTFTLPAVMGGFQPDNLTHMTEQQGKLLFARGQALTVVTPSTMAVAQTSARTAKILGMVNWRGKTRIGYGSQAYMDNVDSITSVVNTTATSTYAKSMVIGDNRWWAVSGNSGGSTENAILYSQDNFVSFSTPFNVGDINIPATGMAVSGPYAITGSETGAFAFTEAGKPIRLLETMKDFRSANNGVSMDTLWGWTYICTAAGLFGVDLSSRYSTVANPVGPEVIPGFEGAINGYPTYVKAWKDSLWVAYLTPTGDTYILRGMFGARTADTGIPTWFPFAKIASKECHFIGGTASKTNPTLIIGEGTNCSYYTMGRMGRDILDANYAFSTAGGTWYSTTLTRDPDKAKALRYCVLHTENCDANNSWQLAVSVNGGSYVNVGGAVITNGQNYLRPVDAQGVPLTTVNGLTMKFRLTQTAASSTTPPQVRSLTAVYDERPDQVEVHVITINANALRTFATNKANIDALNDQRNTPVSCIIPGETATKYALIEDVQEADLKGDGIRGYTVQFSIWEVS